MDRVREHEVSLTAYALRTLEERYGSELAVHGPSEPACRGGVLSMSFRDIHPHDLSQVLDDRGVCVRAGHHCAKPLMRHLGVPATTRASLYVYNDTSDVDALADALARLSVFAAANAGRIESIDINPFIALPEGGVAADALIVPKRTAQ